MTKQTLRGLEIAGGMMLMLLGGCATTKTTLLPKGANERLVLSTWPKNKAPLEKPKKPFLQEDVDVFGKSSAIRLYAWNIDRGKWTPAEAQRNAPALTQLLDSGALATPSPIALTDAKVKMKKEPALVDASTSLPPRVPATTSDSTEIIAGLQAPAALPAMPHESGQPLRLTVNARY